MHSECTTYAICRHALYTKTLTFDLVQKTGDIISTVKVDMAAETEVLINSLLLQIEVSRQC